MLPNMQFQKCLKVDLLSFLQYGVKIAIYAAKIIPTNIMSKFCYSAQKKKL